MTRLVSTRPRTAGAAVATLAALGLLAGCGDDTADTASDGSAQQSDGSGDPGSSEETPATDVSAECPGELAGGVGGALEPATEAPVLAEPVKAWICRYELQDGWQLDGDPVEVPSGDLDAVAQGLAGLQPAGTDLLCTEELGPRWLLTTVADDGTTTDVVVDDFGCRSVLLSDDAADTVPGQARGSGLVVGALSSPDDLAATLAGLYGG